LSGGGSLKNGLRSGAVDEKKKKEKGKV